MKTLILAYRYPLPANSGDKLRTKNFVEYFIKMGEVDIMYYHADNHVSEADSPFRKAYKIDPCKDGERVDRLEHFFQKIKYSKPWAVADFSKQSLKAIVHIIEKGAYDIILCRNALCAFPIFFLSDKYKSKFILDIDDLISAKLYSATIEDNNRKLISVSRAKKYIDFKLFKSYQFKCSNLGKSLVCSEVDLETVKRQINPEKLFMVPNIAPEFKSFNGYKRNGRSSIATILFVGHLSYIPNVQGMEWFVDQIYSQLKNSGVGLKLIVAGRNPAPLLKLICKRHHEIRLVENPPEIAPLYDECGAVIVPLLAGGGTRIKILEAGLACRPIFTTEIGAYGLGLKDYEHVLYFSDFQSFLDRWEWLNNNDNYNKIIENMNRFVARNYSFQTFTVAMDAVVRSCVGHGA